jgi:hypothetical protein
MSLPFLLGPFLAETTAGMGVMGAIISGTNATAKNVERVRNGSASQTEAVMDVGNEALKNGLATAATFAVVASLGFELVAAVGLTLVVGTTLKYAWDRGHDAVEADLKKGKKRPVRQKRPVKKAVLTRVAKASPSSITSIAA